MGKAGNQGISSNKLVHKPVKVGQAARGKNPAHISQLGNHVGDHFTDGPRSSTNYRGEPRFTSSPVNAGQRLGNETARELSGANAGCGKGRTIYAQGTQQSGAVRPIGSTRDSLAEFGPDSPNVAARK